MKTKQQTLKYGLYVFNGDKVKFKNWLSTYNHLLKNYPYSLLGTEELYTTLQKIDYTIFN